MSRILMSIILLASTVSANASTITTTYVNLPREAQLAFAKAEAIWERCLETDAEIKIRVTGIERGPTGFALPRGVRNLQHLPMRDTWYPTALANALNGKRDNDQDDMNIFMSLKTNWHYAGDNIQPGQTDYVNVAVHEIAHGLGISSGSFIPWQGEKIGQIGLPNEYINFFQLSFDLPDLDGTPLVYDRFIKSATNAPITSYDNPSTDLAVALSSEGIYFDGNSTGKILVTPGNISHIPKQANMPTPIMLSNSGIGESIQQPDPILLSMLEDIGWRIKESCKL